MEKSTSIDNRIFNELNEDIAQTRKWGYVFILSSLLLQILHYVLDLISGFTFMLVLTGIILFIAGILFILGSSSVPKSRIGLIKRLQTKMLDKNPKRRLWAAQRLVGYMKDGNFIKEDILEITKSLVSVVSIPPVHEKYQKFIAVDHLVVIREIAISVKMNKHVRKDFIRIVKPLNNLKGLPNEAYELISDAIGYFPSKLPVQAYNDMKKEKI